jgi:DNA-binding XRE family transcriptional regulator
VSSGTNYYLFRVLLRTLIVPARSVDARAFARQTLAGTLKRARNAAGMTQADLAKTMRISQARVSQVEHGLEPVSCSAAMTRREMGFRLAWRPSSVLARPGWAARARVALQVLARRRWSSKVNSRLASLDWA